MTIKQSLKKSPTSLSTYVYETIFNNNVNYN